MENNQNMNSNTNIQGISTPKPKREQYTIFPCKSNNLYKFLLSKGFKPEYIITDARDNKKISMFIRSNELHNALSEWSSRKPRKDNI